MKKVISILFAIPVILSVFATPTVVVAQEQGTHSSERPGMWDLEHPRRHRWIYNDDGESNYRDNRDYHQGYRPHREYRYNDNSAWIPGAAALLGMGILLGSQPRYAAPRPRYQYDHVQYCMNRYRSYRAWDNTYQPNYGPRRVCR